MKNLRYLLSNFLINWSIETLSIFSLKILPTFPNSVNKRRLVI